ncbi:hypothetical protein [Nitrincola sp. MINF-07-Sa-05]|uniref:hypothetical protein n=1 Tax=Nitrincola salilacus TaxID=3400273 RepID=UPI003917C7D8
MNFLKIVATTFLAVSFFASAASESHSQIGQLSSSIRSMLEQEYDKFVIVEIPKTRNYFQYAAEDNGAYIFDVPVMSLTPDQNQRAVVFFSSRGIGVTSVKATNFETMESFTLESYQKLYKGDDAKGGASMGINFMIEVLQYTDEITIIEGWQ